MPLPSKVQEQDTLARSLNNLTVVSDTALQELATVPTRQADKLQLLLNKLLERAELEASSSQAASSSGANLGPDSSSAPALDVVRTLEASLDAAGGGLANDDIEQLAAAPASSLSPWLAHAPADSSASGNDPPPGLQSYDPAASGGHDQFAFRGRWRRPLGWLERSAAWAA